MAEAGLEREVDVVVGTLGKALGSYGAFAACDAELAQLLINTARPLIFSTAPPPPAVAGALAALEVLAEQPRRVDRLQANAEVLRAELAREGFDVSGSTTQIVPLIVGDATTAMRVCEAALERGVFAQAIRPPTVPDGTSRLRLAVMATHTKDELRDAAQVLGRAALQAGFRPATAMPVAAAHEAVHATPFAHELFDAEAETSRRSRPARGACRARRSGPARPWPRAAASSPAPTPARARRSSPRRCARRSARPANGSRRSSPSSPGPTSPAADGWPADHELLASVTGARPEDVCTQTYGPAVSPHLAAQLAGAALALEPLVAAARVAAAGADVLVVEGVGGLLVPLNAQHDVRDLAVALGLPLVIAARPGLGTINHSLLTIAAARAARPRRACGRADAVAGGAVGHAALESRDDRGAGRGGGGDARGGRWRRRPRARGRDAAVGRMAGGGSF